MVTIKSLEVAEGIVDSHRQLHWDGWDIVELRRNNSAVTRTDGVYVNGLWYTQRRFTPSRDGWKLPKRYA